MEHFLRTKDFLVSGEDFELLHDPGKHLLLTSPLPADLAPYYQSEDYISHTDSKKGILALCYQLVKQFSTKKKFRLINRYAGQKKSLLDIGAGTGDFLAAARKNGYDIAGVEPSKGARAKAQNKGILLMDHLEASRRFQIITLWHVLEHIPDPEKEITKIKKLLEEDGALFIALPNFRSYDAEYYKEYWAGYDVPRHIWHFSKEAVKQLVQNHGMEIVETRPMPFDAFYISLLSEKYKNGTHRYFKAFRLGLLSNWKAKRSGQYSSILYIIKKRP